MQAFPLKHIASGKELLFAITNIVPSPEPCLINRQWAISIHWWTPHVAAHFNVWPYMHRKKIKREKKYVYSMAYWKYAIYTVSDLQIQGFMVLLVITPFFTFFHPLFWSIFVFYFKKIRIHYFSSGWLVDKWLIPILPSIHFLSNVILGLFQAIEVKAILK